jgi:Tol biopolymer transport system component
VGAVIVAAAGIGYGLWSSRRGGEPGVVPFQNMRLTTQTSRGDVNFSALSPDGRYLAYVAGSAGRSTLRVRQVATGSDVEVLPVRDAGLESPSFSPDGNYVYFLKRQRDQPNYRSLVRVPSLGGPEEERAFDVDSRVTFSPDAKSICFMRGVPQEQRSALVVRNLEAGTEREFVSIRQPEVLAGPPSWSPDGKRIAAWVIIPPPRLASTLVMFDAQTARRENFLVMKNAVLTEVAWNPDGRGLVACGTVVSEGISNQVFVVTYPDAEVGRVTNDFDTYNNVSASSGEASIAALRTSQVANLYVANPADGSVRKLTNATSHEHSPFGFDVAADRVLFTAVHERRLGLGSVPLAGGEARRFTAGPGHATALIVRGNLAIIQRYDDNEQQHIWRLNLDGTGLAQVTTGGGEQLLDVSRDGRLLCFSRTDSTLGVWVMPVLGGDAVEISRSANSGLGLFSPDGQSVTTVDLVMGASGLIQNLLRIIPATGGEEIARFIAPPEAVDPEWENGTSWTYLERDDPARNVHRRRGENESPQRITKFTDGRLLDHTWSFNRRRIALIRQGDEGENVWVVDADGGNPRQVTRFDGEDIFQLRWTLDSERIVVRAGTQSRDVVVMSAYE